MPNKYCCLIPTVLSWPCMVGLSFPSYKSFTGYLAPGFAMSASQTIPGLAIDVRVNMMSNLYSILLTMFIFIISFILLPNKPKIINFFHQWKDISTLETCWLRNGWTVNTTWLEWKIVYIEMLYWQLSSSSQQK